MFEHFTEHARHVMSLANREAQRFGHEYVATEHMLWAIAKECHGVAAAVLEHFGVDLKPLRQEVETLLEGRPHVETVEKLPPSTEAKEVMAFALEEVRALNHSHIGTEHILLGLMRDRAMVSAQVLANLGLELDAVRVKIQAVTQGG